MMKKRFWILNLGTHGLAIQSARVCHQILVCMKADFGVETMPSQNADIDIRSLCNKGMLSNDQNFAVCCKIEKRNI